MLLYVNLANVVGSQCPLLAQETQDVSFAHFVLLAFAYIERAPAWLHGLQRAFWQVVGGQILGQVRRQGFLGVEQQESASCGLPARRASVAVDEGLLARRQVVVDYVLQPRYVKPAGSQVGRHQHGATAVSELVERAFAVGLLHAAVVGLGRKLQAAQVGQHAVGALAVVDEHQRRTVAQPAEQAIEGLQLVFLGRQHAVEAQAVGGLVGCQEVQPGDFAQPREAGYLFGIGGRQQHALAQPWQAAYEGGHFVVEAQLQTLVELVNHQRGHRACVEVLLVQVVVQSARRAHDDGGMQLLHGAVLVHGGAAAVAAHGLESGAHGLEHGFGLQGQFARGHHYQCLYAFLSVGQRLCQGQQVGQCLARAGGRQQHQVVVFAVGLGSGYLHGVQLVYFQLAEEVGSVHCLAYVFWGFQCLVSLFSGCFRASWRWQGLGGRGGAGRGKSERWEGGADGGSEPCVSKDNTSKAESQVFGVCLFLFNLCLLRNYLIIN